MKRLILIMLVLLPFTVEARQHNPGAQRGYIHPIPSSIAPNNPGKQRGDTSIQKPKSFELQGHSERIGGQAGK